MAAPSSLGEKIREELSCSICQKLFTRPKMLPCQHTFCQDCLQDHAGRGGTFQCPNCRQQVKLPRQGVAGLPDSHIVAKLCERLQNQARVSGETRESGNRCSFHPSEEIKLYCKQCQVPLCVDCVEECHNGHPTMGLKTVIQEHRGPVQALITEGRGILETYSSFVRGLREQEKSLDDEKQQTDSKIEEAYREACDKMTEEKDRLLSEVETNHRQNKGAVQTQRDAVLADVAELSSVCDGAEQDMAREGGQFLSHESKLSGVVGKFREKTVPSPVQTHPAVFEPTVNFSCTLGKVTVPGATSSATAAMGHHHGNPTHTIAPIRLLTFVSKGSERNEYNRLRGLAVSSEEIFVEDHGNKRIQVFTLQGTFVRQFPTVVFDDKEMAPYEARMYPCDVTMDWEGNLCVVGILSTCLNGDPYNFVVQYDKQGRVLRKFHLQKTGQESGRSRGVAVDTRRNHILITQITGDRPNLNGEVLVFRPDGTLVRTVGQQQGMKEPLNITVDGEGNIFVSDCGNHCVYVYNEDGQFLFKFGGEGSGEGQLKDPNGICTDRAGNIIVADRENSRVEMFDKTGRFIKHITTDMTEPCAVAMAPQGQLVVTDLRDNIVTIFKNSDCG